MLETLLTKDSLAEGMLGGAPSCSEACLFFSNDLLHLQLQSVRYDLQHDSALLADKANHLVVLALLQVAVGSVMTKDWVQRVGQSPVCQILLQIVMTAMIISSPPACTSAAGMLLTPADYPFFNDCTTATTSWRWMGWLSSVSVWGQFSTDGSPLALWLQLTDYRIPLIAVFCPSVQYLSFFCEAFS